MSESYITCTKCGYNNRTGARFCRSCGNSLYMPPQAVNPTELTPPPAFSPTPPPPPAYYPPPQPQPAGKQVKSESCLVTVLGGSFAGLCVLLLCFAIPYYFSMSELLEPGIYKRALILQDFYNRLPDLFVEQMDYSKPATLELEGVSCIQVQNFTRSDWEIIAEIFMPPDWVNEETESLIHQFFDFLQSDDDDPLVLQITASQFKELLKSDEGFEFYHGITSNKPACSLGDVFTIGSWVMDPHSACLIVCRPILDINKNIWEIVTSFAGVIPTQYNLNNFLNIQPLEDLRPIYRLAETVKNLCPVLLLVAFLCLILSLVSRRARSMQGILLFWGLPLALAGLICILIAILLPIISQWMISDMARAADFYSGVEEILVDITRQMTTELARDIGLPAMILLAAGSLMSLASLGWGFVRRLLKV